MSTLADLGRFLSPRRQSPNPPARGAARRPPPHPAPTERADGFTLRDIPEGFELRDANNRTVAAAAWGSAREVATYLSEQGWYELSDTLFQRRGTVAYVSVSEEEETAFRAALRALEGELRRRGVTDVYAHGEIADLDDVEASARVLLWSRCGYDEIGEDRQHEPMLFRRLPA